MAVTADKAMQTIQDVYKVVSTADGYLSDWEIYKRVAHTDKMNVSLDWAVMAACTYFKECGVFDRHDAPTGNYFLGGIPETIPCYAMRGTKWVD